MNNTTNDILDFTTQVALTTGSDFMSSMSNVTANTTEGIGAEDAGRSFSTPLVSGMILAGILGVVGNAFVIVVIFSSTSMYKKVTNMFIINQSVLDLVGSVILLVTAVMKYWFGVKAITLGRGASAYCHLIHNETLMYGVFVASTYNLVALAVERYIAILHPFSHKRSFTPPKILLVILLVWSLSIAHKLIVNIIPSGMLEGVCKFSIYWPNKSSKTGTGFYSFLVQFLLPLGIMCFCYGKIVMAMRSRVEVMGKETASTARAKRNTLKTLIIITACFVICWAPNSIIFFFFNFGVLPLSFLWGPFSVFTKMLININCCANPFIYAANYEAFQKGIRKLFCPNRGASGGDENSVQPSTTTTQPE